MRRHALSGLLLLLAAGSAAAASPPAATGDGWPVGTLAEAGFDAAAVDEIAAAIRRGEHGNTHALLIEHKGRLVYEAYFAGEDMAGGRKPLGVVAFDRETLHDLRSVTKSVTAALLGIALAGEDYDAALDRPLPRYFSELADDPGVDLERVTLRHVLTMTAGLEWNEMEVPYSDRRNDEIRMSFSRDPLGMVLARPVRDPPGSRWTYNGGLTQLVAGILERRTGKTVDKYAETALFGPLAIADYAWRGSPAWPAGLPNAASGLRLRPRDLAKIGSLFLNGGRWQGRQVVPAEWVALSTRRHVASIPWAPREYGYGFMWYRGRLEYGRAYDVIRAAGNGGQRLYILPEEGIVVTVLAGLYNRSSAISGRAILPKVLAARRGAR